MSVGRGEKMKDGRSFGERKRKREGGCKELREGNSGGGIGMGGREQWRGRSSPREGKDTKWKDRKGKEIRERTERNEKGRKRQRERK